MASDYEQISTYNEKGLGYDLTTRTSQVDMYSDFTHFIYELLQNADDYSASEVHFFLEPDRLVIQHNGIAFNTDNVKAISYIGKSTSKEDREKTGRFGLGFKSVFAFTATPIIHSGEESFELFDLYKLKAVPFPSELQNGWTRIILPFNHEEIKPVFVENHTTAKVAYERISNRLQQLDMLTLLFTRNIREIKWDVGKQQGHYLREDTKPVDNSKTLQKRETTITDGNTLRSYLVFSRPISWKDPVSGKNGEYRPVELAFARDSNGNINDVQHPLVVLFATKVETHLNFVLNGPYRTTPNRESVNEENDFNRHLLDETANMMEEVLFSVQDLGLLNREFLAVLPNNTDHQDNQYLNTLKSKIYALMIARPLIPTLKKGSYAPGNSLYRGQKEITDLITDKDLKFLTENYSAQWAVNPADNNRSKEFLKSIGVEEWSVHHLLKFLKAFYHRSMIDLYTGSWIGPSFLEGLRPRNNDKWLRKFYILLFNALNQYSDGDYDCSKWCIVKTEKGELIEGRKAYFPNENISQRTRRFNLVKSSLLEGSAIYQKKIRTFLKDYLGVGEIDERAIIANKLAKDYSRSNCSLPMKQHFRDIEHFVGYWKSTGDIEVFINYKDDYDDSIEYYFLFQDEENIFRQPYELYLDEPYGKSCLAQIYKVMRIKGKDQFNYRALSPIYWELKNIELPNFARALGVKDKLLEVAKTTKVERNPDSEYLLQDLRKPGVKESKFKVREDYIMDGLDSLLELEDQNVSKVIWQELLSMEPKYLIAKYCPNADPKYREREAKSQLAHILSDMAWIPDRNGRFRKPAEMTKDMLPKGFRFEEDNECLRRIGFGENVRIESEESKRMRELAEEWNVLPAWIEKLKTLPLGEQKKLLEESRLAEAQRPTKASSNPGRRAKKVEGEIADAPLVKSEERQRMVRTSYLELRKETRKYLVEHNTNENKQLICQVCHAVMPFKINGDYYFEAVKCVTTLKKEVMHNRLALCPLCAAKYAYANAHKPIEIEKIVLEAPGDEITLTLAGSEATIHFTSDHINDLKVALQTLRSPEEFEEG